MINYKTSEGICFPDLFERRYITFKDSLKKLSRVPNLHSHPFRVGG